MCQNITIFVVIWLCFLSLNFCWGRAKTSPILNNWYRISHGIHELHVWTDIWNLKPICLILFKLFEIDAFIFGRISNGHGTPQAFRDKQAPPKTLKMTSILTNNLMKKRFVSNYFSWKKACETDKPRAYTWNFTVWLPTMNVKDVRQLLYLFIFLFLDVFLSFKSYTQIQILKGI